MTHCSALDYQEALPGQLKDDSSVAAPRSMSQSACHMQIALLTWMKTFEIPDCLADLQQADSVVVLGGKSHPGHALLAELPSAS